MNKAPASFAKFFGTLTVAKKWNKFFYRNPKGSVDPDSQWRWQNEQHENNEVYKMVNFSGGGRLIEEFDKGTTLEDKKKCVQEYFQSVYACDYLHEDIVSVTEDDYKKWHKEQDEKAKTLQRKEDDLQSPHGWDDYKMAHASNNNDNDFHSIVSLDSVVSLPFSRHGIKWKLEKRGAIGETALHLLFLNGSEKHINIAEALLEIYPDLAIDLYEGFEYYGESCLHFAIVQNNLKAVELLLDTEQVDVHARARGKFFVPIDVKRGDVKLRKHKFEGYAYFGEFPLSFAASVGNDEIYDRLIKKGADPDKKDRYGNNVLHLTVIHNQPDMYEHALRHNNPADPHVSNNDGLTPLALAAKLGKKEMFDKILEISSRHYWSYNTVTCSAYPLKSLDTIGADGSTDWNSALMMIVRGKKEGHFNMVSHFVVHQLLEEKWNKFARDKFIRLLFFFILHLIFLSVAIYLRPDEMTDLRYGTSAPDIARYVFEAMVVLVCWFVIGFAFREIYLEKFYGFWQNLASIPSRIIYLFAVFLILLCVPMRFLELYIVEEWLLVFAVPGTWTYFLFFLRNSSITGPFITMIYRISATDMVRFVVIYIIILGTCAVAFFYQFEGQNIEPFFTELGTIMTLFQMSLGEFDYPSILQGKYQALTILMFIAFMIVVHILLLNMLIAMITRTFEKIIKQSEKVWKQQWASMVVAMERSHSKHDKITFQNSYDLNIESNRVTGEGDAEVKTINEVPLQLDRRALMVQYQQSKSVGQRRRERKEKLWKQIQQQPMTFHQPFPVPRFQIKSMAGLSDIKRDAPRLDEEKEVARKIFNGDMRLHYSDDDDDDNEMISV